MTLRKREKDSLMPRKPNQIEPIKTELLEKTDKTTSPPGIHSRKSEHVITVKRQMSREWADTEQHVATQQTLQEQERTRQGREIYLFGIVSATMMVFARDIADKLMWVVVVIATVAKGGPWLASLVKPLADNFKKKLNVMEKQDPKLLP